MPRGGRRQGRAGVNYANRSDLAASAALPVSAVPNQPYGAAGQQMVAQQAVPMAPSPMPAPAAPPQPTASALPASQPGQLGAFDRPTERPHEPVTAGLATGAGPGPEALGFGGMTQPQTVAGLLQSIASFSPEANDLLARVNQGRT